MIRGTVKIFFKDKGWGFIAPDKDAEHEEDVFVHYAAVESPRSQILEDGDRVCFDVDETPRGLLARNVSVFNEEREASGFVWVEQKRLEELRRALGVAADALDIASDWNINEVQVDPPPEWNLSARDEDPGTGWCSVQDLVEKLRQLAKY